MGTDHGAHLHHVDVRGWQRVAQGPGQVLRTLRSRAVLDDNIG
jgi:hypothetical protein